MFVKKIPMYLIALFAYVFCLSSCDNASKDVSYPIIDDENFLPVDCAEFNPGGTIQVVFNCHDDMELGSFNVEIHSNFDHHSHGTSSVECEEHHHEADSNVKGWVFNQDYDIPAEQKEYSASLDIPIPDDAAQGEYHFMLRLTDHAGWQTIKAVPIHIEHP